jgi:transposase
MTPPSGRARAIQPHAYFTDVLTKLVNLWPASRIDELMPWAWGRERSENRVAA